MLARSIIVDRVPDYELATGGTLRALDATEHNMERLNAMARGSSRTYHALIIEGPLSRSSLQQALDLLATRHPLLGVRIVRSADGALFYAPAQSGDGPARVPVSYVVAQNLSAWPELVEADMNAGAIATGRGQMIGFAVLEPPGLEDGANGRRVLVMVGHHGVCDGTSALALLHELLEQIASPRVLDKLECPPLADPFCLEMSSPELAEIETELRVALDARDSTRRQRREALKARLEQLERRLLAQRDSQGHYPVALKAVHGLLSSLAAELLPARGIVPEVDVRGAGRYEQARTALHFQSLGKEPTQALRRAAKERGLTLHGAFAAAVLLAFAAEANSGERPERLALASAVSLRKQLVPPLSPHDLRMAVDILISRIPVEPGTGFWELARRVGDDVTRAVANARALSSSFRTVRRNFAETPPGVAIPLISNLGKVELATHYGPLKVLELCAAMTAHGSFQLAALFLTFDERLGMSFYCETPTVSRTTLERIATRVVATLSAVAAGDEPKAPG